MVLDPEMAQLLILSNWNFKTTVIKMLKDLVEWMDSMQKPKFQQTDWNYKKDKRKCWK